MKIVTPRVGPVFTSLYTKYKRSGPCEFKLRFLKIEYRKPIFWIHDLLMQPITTVWTALVGDHLRIMPVNFGQNPMSDFRDVYVNMLMHDDRQRLITIAHPEHFVLG